MKKSRRWCKNIGFVAMLLFCVLVYFKVGSVVYNWQLATGKVAETGNAFVGAMFWPLTLPIMGVAWVAMGLWEHLLIAVAVLGGLTMFWPITIWGHRRAVRKINADRKAFRHMNALAVELDIERVDMPAKMARPDSEL